MSNETANQTHPFKSRVFPASTVTELALCLTQLLHLEYDGKLESGSFGFSSNSFHSSMFYQELWKSYNSGLPRGTADPWVFKIIPKGNIGTEFLRNSISRLDPQFPHVVCSFLKLICRRIHLQFYLLSFPFSAPLPFHSCSFPILPKHTSLWCIVSEDSLKCCSLRGICSLRHPKFPFP